MDLRAVELDLPRASCADRSGRPASNSSSVRRSTAWSLPGEVFQQLHQRLTLSLLVARSSGKPGAQGESLIGWDALGREPFESLMGRRRCHPGDSEVQLALPHGTIVRPTPEAVVQPAPGSDEVAGTDREVGAAKPDPVVIRRLRGRTVQSWPDLFDRYRNDRVEIGQLPEEPETVRVVSANHPQSKSASRRTALRA